MGIKGLLPELSGAITKCHLAELSGLTAGIDVSCWIHRCLEGKMTPLQFIARKVGLLHHHKITSVIVFDGEDIDAKWEIREHRQKKRDKLVRKAEELAAQGNQDEAKKLRMRSTPRTGSLQNDIKTWCRSHNVKFVQSAYEADAQLAYLQRHGIIDFAISEDSDLIVYGCHRVLYKFCNEEGEMYNKKLLKGTWLYPWNLNCLQAVCILVGSDYWKSGLPGFGIKSATNLYSNLTPNYSFKKLCILVDQLGKSLDKDSFMRAFSTFQHQLVVDHKTGHKVPLTPYQNGKSAIDYPYAGKQDETKYEIFNPKAGPINLTEAKKIETQYFCSLCPDVFCSPVDLKSHRHKVHPITCHICNGHFNYLGELADHLKVHEKNPEANQICDECGKAFVTKRQLTKHRSKVHRAESHICPQCPKAFKSRTELKRHVAVHSDERKFVCNICGAGFKQKDGLRNHMASKHSSGKSHVCDECGRGFTSKRGLHSHVSTYHSGKSHVCETCGKAFTAEKILSRHQTVHSDEKAHVCDTCGNGFKTKGTLDRHRRTQH